MPGAARHGFQDGIHPPHRRRLRGLCEGRAAILRAKESLARVVVVKAIRRHAIRAERLLRAVVPARAGLLEPVPEPRLLPRRAAILREIRQHLLHRAHTMRSGLAAEIAIVPYSSPLGIALSFTAGRSSHVAPPSVEKPASFTARQSRGDCETPPR